MARFSTKDLPGSYRILTCLKYVFHIGFAPVQKGFLVSPPFPPGEVVGKQDFIKEELPYIDTYINIYITFQRNDYKEKSSRN